MFCSTFCHFLPLRLGIYLSPLTQDMIYAVNIYLSVSDGETQYAQSSSEVGKGQTKKAGRISARISKPWQDFKGCLKDIAAAHVAPPGLISIGPDFDMFVI